MRKEELLKDHKEFMKEVIDPNDEACSSFELLMLSFNYFLNDEKSKSEREYEEKEQAYKIYKELGWDSEKNYDVISSCYTILKSSLAYSNALSEDTETSYCFDEGNYFCYRVYGNKYFPICKKRHIEKIVDENNITCHKAVYNHFLKEDVNAEKIEELAALCHSSANFTPVPSPKFNIMKGCVDSVYDYLPLLVDKIQYCIDNNEIMSFETKDGEICADIEELKKWRVWLVENVDKYALSDYYSVEDSDDGSKRLEGKPLFETQTLNNPLPKSQDEVSECLENMLSRIKKRAERMSKINNM